MKTAELSPDAMDKVAAAVFSRWNASDWQKAADWEFSARMRMEVVVAGRAGGHSWINTEDFDRILGRLQAMSMKAVDDRDGLVHGNDPEEPADLQPFDCEEWS